MSVTHHCMDNFRSSTLYILPFFMDLEGGSDYFWPGNHMHLFRVWNATVVIKSTQPRSLSFPAFEPKRFFCSFFSTHCLFTPQKILEPTKPIRLADLNHQHYPCCQYCIRWGCGTKVMDSVGDFDLLELL